MPRVSIAHDYLTVRGGAERVVLSLAKAFPDAIIHTALYDPTRTFPDFAGRLIEASSLNRVGLLRNDHRRALPFLALTWSRTHIDADMVVCSSSGWAHGASVTGRKIVYCHTPARWLYQRERYLRTLPAPVRLLARATHGPLIWWDRRASASVDRYVANSRVVRDRIRQIYGHDAEVVHPPHSIDPWAKKVPLPDVEPPFWLTVARLQPYKNIDATIDAFSSMPYRRLVVVGTGSDMDRLRLRATSNVHLVGSVSDGQLRWAYDNCVGLVATSYEDFGLTPLEAAAFGKPTVALRFGGYLDTVIEGETGTFVSEPTPTLIRDGVDRLAACMPDSISVKAHGDKFSEDAFVSRIRTIVADELSVGLGSELGSWRRAGSTTWPFGLQS